MITARWTASTILSLLLLLLLLTSCAPPSPDIAAFVQALETATESEAGTSVGATGGDISDVPSKVNFGGVSGKGPFTVYFTCQVPRGSVTLTLDSTTTTEVDCNAGIAKVTEIQQIALAGGLNIEVQGEAKAGIWALVAKGRA